MREYRYYYGRGEMDFEVLRELFLNFINGKKVKLMGDFSMDIMLDLSGMKNNSSFNKCSFSFDASASPSENLVDVEKFFEKQGLF